MTACVMEELARLVPSLDKITNLLQSPSLYYLAFLQDKYIITIFLRYYICQNIQNQSEKII
jgi:hypothetical protein